MLSGNRGFGWAGAALVAGVLVSQLRGTAASQPQPKNEAKPAETEAAPEPEPRKLVSVPAPAGSGATCCTITLAEPPKAEPDCDGGKRLLASYHALYQPDRLANYRFLIVLTPDPEESGHVDYFDAVLEGVDDAVAAGSQDFWREKEQAPRRYVRDRHYLPWSKDPKRRSGCAAKTPGVVLYRPIKDASTEPSLVVLLVGETPTWGIRESQWSAALGLADDHRYRGAEISRVLAAGSASATGNGLTRWYRVLGPTFSGSAASLAALIRRHAAAVHAEPTTKDVQLAYRIASGTATGPSLVETLNVNDAARGFRMQYASAVPDDEALLRAMLGFLPNERGQTNDPKRSVLLSESLTAYGESVTARESVAGSQLVGLRFPPNLISLRRAYAEAPPADSSGGFNLAPSNAKAATEEGKGELSDQTPITHDLALSEMLRQLNRRGVRNIGLVATDARDVVFLAERVKRQLPDMRLFTLGFDLRFLHPDHASVLNGMLVAHAAPRMKPPPSSVLENPMTAGVFDAGRFLLANQALSPVARVSLIGNGSLYQIGPDLDAKGKVVASVLEVPPGFNIVYLLTIVVFVVVLFVVGAPALVGLLTSAKSPLPVIAKRSAFLRQRTGFWAELGSCEHLDLAADHAVATAALVTIAVSAPVVMATAAFRPHSRSEFAVAFGALLAVVLAFTWIRTRGKWKQACRSAFLLGLLVSGVGVFATALGCGSPREATLTLLSGGSPLIGGLLGLGMLLVVVWCWRSRLRLLDTLRFGALPGARFFENEAPPISALLGRPAASEFMELERRLLRVLRSPWLSAPLGLYLVNGLLLLSLLYVMLVKPPLTFEHGFRHVVLVLFVCACVFPITTSFARILATTRALMRLLHGIGRLPQAEALRRLPKELARRLETQLTAGGRSVGELTHPIGALRRLGVLVTGESAFASQADRELTRELAYESGAPATPEEEAKATHGPAELTLSLIKKSAELEARRTEFGVDAATLIDDYQAQLIAIFIARYVRNLRLLVPPVVVGSLLAVLMTSLYFVQPQHLIATVCFLWVSVMVVGVVAVYVRLARDEVLSAIGRTTAGEIQPSFSLGLRLLAVLLVPLTGLLASQYPQFAYWVSSVLGAAARIAQ